MLWSPSIFRGYSTLDTASSRVTYSILRAYTGTANTGKTRERFWKKNAGEKIGRVEISKEKIPGSKRGMHGDILTSSRL